MSQFSRLSIRTEEVTIPGGDTFTVRALGFEEIVAVVMQYREKAEALWVRYAEVQEMDDGIFAALLGDAPDLSYLIIALAGDGTPEDMDNIRKIGVAAQMDALEKVATLTFESYGGPGKVFEMAVRLMQKGSEGLRELNTSKAGSLISGGKQTS